MFKLRYQKSISQVVKGIFKTPIQYEQRLKDGESWSSYFGKYENQRWGEWDSDSCWALSAINSLEDQIEWLWKNGQFGQEAKDFFTSNGYIDSDGDISLSERFIEVKGGFQDKGSNSPMAWTLIQEYGCIPRSMLTYSLEQSSKFGTKSAFNADYFNPLAVTSDMLILGKKFRQYVNIAYQTIGKNWYTPTKDVLQAALKQAPICIGVHAAPYSWNRSFIQFDGLKTVEHEVELYAVNPDGSYAIFDQYLPTLKTLSADYYLPLCTQGIAYAIRPAAANPTPQPSSWWLNFFTAVNNWYNQISNSFPIG